MTASRKAERLSGVGLPRPSPGGTACRRVPERGFCVHFRKKRTYNNSREVCEGLTFFFVSAKMIKKSKKKEGRFLPPS